MSDILHILLFLNLELLTRDHLTVILDKFLRHYFLHMAHYLPVATIIVHKITRQGVVGNRKHHILTYVMKARKEVYQLLLFLTQLGEVLR